MSLSLLLVSIVALLLLGILISLALSMFFLLKEPQNSPKVVKALSVRVILSIALFVFLIIAFLFGWITPHALTG